MSKSVNLSFNDLYYLGVLLDAEHIDYGYIQGMDDIDEGYDLFVSEALSSLQAKGLVMQSFSGDVTVSESVKELVSPIFFGNDEVEIQLLLKKDDNETSMVKKIHKFNDKTVCVTIDDKGTLELTEELNLDLLKAKISDAVDTSNIMDEEIEIEEVKEKQPNMILTLKKVVDLEQVSSNAFVAIDKKLYIQQESTLKSIPVDVLFKSVDEILEEGNK